jgi:hypothetical protein
MVNGFVRCDKKQGEASADYRQNHTTSAIVHKLKKTIIKG